MLEVEVAIFITGTDTDVGKTIISTWICKQSNASYWKPIQTGMVTDSSFVNSYGIKTYPEAYKFSEPLSPHVFAKVDTKTIKLPTKDPLVVEGAGGVLVPLNSDSLMVDLIKQLELPVVIVVRSLLGTINHSLLTIEALRVRKIPIVGVIMNGEFNQSNKEAIEQYGKVPVLAEFPLQKELDLSIPLPSAIKKLL